MDGLQAHLARRGDQPSFVSPLFYVVAMGVLLGGFIEGDPAKLEGATSYLAFIVPGLVAAHAMAIAVGETTYPVMGGSSGTRPTARRSRRRSSRGTSSRRT